MNPRVACFTGRFQPFHNQHLEVVEALSHTFKRIIIGVTNPDISKLQAHNASLHRHTDEANPFTFESRVRIIRKSLTKIEKVRIDIFHFVWILLALGMSQQKPFLRYGFLVHGKRTNWHSLRPKATRPFPLQHQLKSCQHQTFVSH